MSDALKDYMRARGATPLDPKVLASHAAEMEGEVIPAIVEDIRAREELAAELRYSASSSLRFRKKRG
ncbi:hypothetical protein [Novosphingobium sp. Gsoil 351]|uniref:hypothetical protein n=1 Tax=Novosphingobium sp. Gsoil 351 TaxID=2675225 RepID=UPI0012B44D79|nr:hypothetical protein [Novosphingobium sp. Gsoil 351]QGN54080.1 hypothetical protein GKE62_05510 [Novosphingobium sp. Gsoil 351]